MAYRNNHLTSVQQTSATGSAQSKSGNSDPFSYLSHRAYRVDGVDLRKKMAEGNKMAGWYIADIIGAGFIGQGWVSKIDTVPEYITVGIGLIYFAARTLFYIRRQRRIERREEWEQRERERGNKVA